MLSCRYGDFAELCRSSLFSLAEYPEKKMCRDIKHQPDGLKYQIRLLYRCKILFVVAYVLTDILFLAAFINHIFF